MMSLNRFQKSLAFVALTLLGALAMPKVIGAQIQSIQAGAQVVFPGPVAGPPTGGSLEFEFHGYVGVRGSKLNEQGQPQWVEELPPLMIQQGSGSNRHPVVVPGATSPVAIPWDSGQRVISRAEYEALRLQNPTLSPLPPDELCPDPYNSSNVCLFQAGPCVPPDPGRICPIQTVLVNAQNFVQAASIGIIHHKVAFMDTKESGGFGQCFRGPSATERYAVDSFGTRYTYEDPQDHFETCDTGWIEKVLQPLIGVEVDTSARFYFQAYSGNCGGIPNCVVPQPGAFTEAAGRFPAGHYALPFRVPPSYFFDARVYAILRYNGIDPRVKLGGVYFENRLAAAGTSPAIVVNGVPIANLASHRTVNFGIEAALLVGTAQFANADRSDPLLGGIPLGTAEGNQPAEVNGDIPMNDGEHGEPDYTEYTYAKPIVVPTPGAAPTPVVDDRKDRGLLRNIRRENLSNTDLYLYTLGDVLIFQRKGLLQNETAGLVCTCPDGSEPSIGNDCVGKECTVEGHDHKARFHFQSFIPLRLVNDRYKLYVVNRATGYIGSAIVKLDTNGPMGLPLLKVEGDSGLGDLSGSDCKNNPAGLVCMRPPNLEIQVDRVREDDHEYQVAFEGSGLSTDNLVKITTQWLDWSGGPLPQDLPGFTGRLAHVTSPNHLEPASAGGVGHFEIAPNEAIEVVQLPGGPTVDIDTAHFYVHVSGERFSAPAPFGTRFVTRSESGADPTLQDVRPSLYVPIKVGMYNPAATLAQALAGNSDGPVYDEVYRPEMQFSIFELNQLAVQTAGAAPGSPPINLLDANLADLAGMSLIDLLYALLQDQLPLEQFGQNRELVLAFGEYEIRLVIGPGGSIQLLDPGFIQFLTPEDFLTLRLYQSNDEGNVLWQFDGTDQSIDIVLADGKTIVHPNESVQALAITDPPNMEVRWSKVGVRGTAEFEINEGTGLITAPEECGEGHIKIRAQNVDNANTFREEWVRVGCECATCNGAGNGEAVASSIDVKISLGKSPEGGEGGTVFLHADAPSVHLSSPRALEFSSMVEGTEIIRKSGGLRQVVATESLLDVVVPEVGGVPDPFSYELRVYPLEVKGAKIDGVYAIQPDVEPISVWRIENPARDAAQLNDLLVTETRSGRTKTNRYTFTPANGDWTLDKGDGLSQETVSKTTGPGGERIETRTIKDDNNVVASVTRKVFSTFPWGEELIQDITDPNGDALTTTTAYYSDPAAIGSYGKVKSIQRPDGSWTRFTYDIQGRVLNTTSSYLDQPITATDAQARVTQNDYAPLNTNPGGLPISNAATDLNRARPRTVTELVAGQVVSRTYYDFSKNSQGEDVEVVERAHSPSAAFTDPNNLRSTTTLNKSNTNQPGEGQVKESIEPDGTLTRYTYERGNYAAGSGTFTPAANGLAQRTTTTQGTVTSPSGIAHKTTQTISITDMFGNAVREETRVYTGSGYELLTWKETDYQDSHPIATRSSNGAQTSAEWGCCTQDTTTDPLGITTTYTFDDIGRTHTETRSGITTTFTYDAAGRQLAATRQGGSLSLSSSQAYDLSGRNTSRIDEQGRVTTTQYANGGRVTTVIRPGGGTEITERFVDGRVKSITGSAVTPRFFTYGINGDGSQWTQVNTGGATSPMFEKTTTDVLGRTVRTERPTFDGGVAVSESFYNDKGQLIRTTEPGRADTIFEYDELGQQVRSGLDVNDNGQLDLASMDRITETDSSFNFEGGAWWQQSSQSVYATDNGGTPTQVVLSQTRVSGFAGDLRSETRTQDVNGNVTVSRTEVDATAARQITSTQFPDSNVAETTVTESGRLTSRTSRTGVTTTFGYDGLGRQTTSVDPRTGASTTHYNAQGLVDFVEDPAGNRTSFVYEADTGRVSVEFNALNKATRKSYDVRGNVTRIWGDVPYPEERVYDDFGRMTELYTFRTGNFSGVDWPIGAQGDRTLWTYQEATGLLLSKTDAANEAVTYTYDDAGQLATRTWARGIVTTYERDPATADVLHIDYSDSTPDVGTTYDRLGRPRTVTDAVGVRAFQYDALKGLTEVIDGAAGDLVDYDHTIVRTYSVTGVVGRNTGFVLDSDHAVTYGYDAVGRIASVGWVVGTEQDVATYTYMPNSDLVAGYTTTGGQAVNYSYEPLRNLRVQVQNVFNGQTASQYTYAYDALGRRVTEVNTGAVFGSGAHGSYGYNDRNEVTAGQRFQGANLADNSQSIGNSLRVYTYDPMGNRISSTEGASSQIYVTNELNQYESVDVDAQTKSFGYDVDGNTVSTSNATDSTVYIYDGESRLVRVEPSAPVEGSQRMVAVYDFMGRRVRQSVQTYSSSTWVTDDAVDFVFNGWQAVKEVSASASTSKDHVYGLDLSRKIQLAGGAGGLLTTVTGVGESYVYSYDGNGNVAQVLTTTGASSASYGYDAFGQQLFAEGSLTSENSFGFSTKRADAVGGLTYYGVRHYDSGVGRWLQRDPMGQRGGTNLYRFVSNQAPRYVDAIGLESEDPQVIEEMVGAVATGNGFTLSDVYKRLRDTISDPRPVFVVMGTEVHRRIFDNYGMKKYGTPRPPGVFFDTRIGQIDPSARASVANLRPDIVNLNTKVVYEAKSIRGVGNAVAEVAQYVAGLRRLVCRPGPDGHEVRGHDDILGIHVEWTYYQPGVIVYDFTGMTPMPIPSPVRQQEQSPDMPPQVDYRPLVVGGAAAVLVVGGAALLFQTTAEGAVLGTTLGPLGTAAGAATGLVVGGAVIVFAGEPSL